MPALYDDEEVMAPLVRQNSDSGASSGKKKGGLIFNRILVILCLGLLAAVSVYFQSSQTRLSQQLRSDEEKIHLLTQTIQAQGQVILRFNQSVTNSDVLKQLKVLKESLETSQHDLQTELNHTIQDVNGRLDQTLANLDETVTKAENEITEQVESVKKDFEKYVVRTEDQFSMENSFMVYQLAGTFTLLSCLISMWHMTAHLRKFKQPFIQRKILAILWMSPIYAITSWFSLVFNGAVGYLAIVKDGYEGYIIYQFLSFCISVLGKGDRQTVVDLLAKRADHLTPPFRLFFCCQRDPYENDRALADAILMQCQLFAMQFVFFRPLTTITKVVLDKYEYYGPWADNPNDYRAIQFYVTLIQNLSIFIAFGGLLKFYHAVDKDLEWCRPFAKFLCIKGVVFMTFWQGLAITILAETTDVGGGNADGWAMSAQNFLICLEMLLFSIAHFYCFPTDEWEEDYKANYNKSKFGDSIALGDFVADLKLLMKGNDNKKKKKPLEPTVPEGDEEDAEDETADMGGEFDDDQNDDETSFTSERTVSMADLEDPQKLIVHVLSENGAESDNPEVEEARKRILKSGFLDEMIFLTPSRQSSLDMQTSYGTESAHPSAAKEEAEQYSRVDSGTEDDTAGKEGEEAATEKTGLLFGASAPSPLRPSIFTTVAAMAEKSESERKGE